MYNDWYLDSIAGSQLLFMPVPNRSPSAHTALQKTAVEALAAGIWISSKQLSQSYDHKVHEKTGNAVGAFFTAVGTMFGVEAQEAERYRGVPIKLGDTEFELVLDGITHASGAPVGGFR